MGIQSDNGKKMYAIVLTYDANIIFVDNLLCKMQKLWPKSGLVFRIAYNKEKPEFLAEKYRNLELEFIQTPAPIKQTVLSMIADLGDEEWIYWCIDDKFPVDLDRKRAGQVLDWVRHQEDQNICGVSFARVRRLKDEHYLDMNHQLRMEGGLNLIKRKNYQTQFWMHQFFRTKIIKRVFNSFPDHNFQAKLMDTYIQEVEMDKANLFFVTDRNLVVFSESASRGIASQSLKRSLKECGISNYADKKFDQSDMVIGHMPTLSSFIAHSTSFKTRVQRRLKRIFHTGG